MELNIVRPFHPDLAEIADDLAQCLRTGMVTNNSAHVRQFEAELQRYYGCSIKPSVNCNGELALVHLFQAWKHKLGLTSHDSCEALVPSFTFVGTLNAMVACNIRPVFCDVDDTLTLDVEKLAVDSPDIRMVVAVGAYGNLCDLAKLKAFADANGLVSILDNAPAFGSKFRGRFPWEYGMSEMISFHATKVVSSMEGGANVVNDPEIADYLLRLRDFGQYEKVRGNVDVPGLNSKMTEVCALVGLRNLAKAEQIFALRARNADRYNRFFGGLAARGLLSIMRVPDDVVCPYLYYPVLTTGDATGFVKYLQDHKIAVRRYYTATHTLDMYRGRYRNLDLTFTEGVKDRVVALPIHTVMSEEEMAYLFSNVESYFREVAA